MSMLMTNIRLFMKRPKWYNARQWYHYWIIVRYWYRLDNKKEQV